MMIHPSLIPYYNWYWYYHEIPDMTIAQSLYYGSSITASQIALDMALWHGYGMRPLHSYVTDTPAIHIIQNPALAAFVAAPIIAGTGYMKSRSAHQEKHPEVWHTGQQDEFKFSFGLGSAVL